MVGADVAAVLLRRPCVRVGGSNYLVPANANPTREATCLQAVDTSLVLAPMELRRLLLRWVRSAVASARPDTAHALAARAQGMADNAGQARCDRFTQGRFCKDECFHQRVDRCRLNHRPLLQRCALGLAAFDQGAPEPKAVGWRRPYHVVVPAIRPATRSILPCRIGKIIGALFLAARVAEVHAAWAARKPEAIEEVDRRLAAAGLTIDAVMAQTLCEHLDEMRGIEAMIAIAEVRRNGALCEIERHRATLAHSLRQTVQQIDAEYQAVDLKLAERKRPS
jgi:hypothetical protein